MIQTPLPPAYTHISDEELHERIALAKQKLNGRVVVLGHHYQRNEIIAHADYTGDSFKLCKDAQRRQSAEYIVFCGVHFMAESADILTPPEQAVILPNLSAGCSMADMATIAQVRRCWDELSPVLDNQKLLPVTYVNSAASIKAFVGEKGGSVCTSSNAHAVITWALAHSDKLIFFPDQHLGRNTAVKLGLDSERDMTVWDPKLPLGGNDAETIKQARIILWRGHCSVHMRFNTEQIEGFRKADPNVKVIVHPECTLRVVQSADFNGSTEYIIKTISAAPHGSSWAVGTEMNLVNRIAEQNPDKTVKCLDPIACLCSTMYRIHPSYLCWVLENLVEGNVVNRIVVPEKTAKYARIALDRMLSIT